MDSPNETDARTPRHRLIDELLLKLPTNTGNLRTLVLENSDGDASLSWRLIAQQIITITGEDITEDAIRGWFANDDEVQAARTAR